MKFAILGPQGAVLTVKDTAPTLSSDSQQSFVKISSTLATTILKGKQAEPKVLYFYENGKFVTFQERMESRRLAAQLNSLNAMPLSKKIELGESHVEKQGFGAARLVTCMDLLLQAKETNTIAQKPKLVAVYQWLQEVKATALAGSITFTSSPFTFEEVLSEA
jgi:hypothetical protein